MTRRMLHPVLIVLGVAIALFSARLAHAQAGGMRANAAPTFRVAVATRALPRGAVLSADDFEFRDTTLRVWSDTSRVSPGWTTRSAIAAGEILRSPAVEPPVVVSANTSVQVEYADGGVRLTLRGIATRNASLGERVQVRIDSGKRLDCTVVAPGRVRID